MEATKKIKKVKVHQVVSHDEWTAARKELLEAEKELTRKRTELAQKRRDLPWEEVSKDYEFETIKGTIKLSELCGDDEDRSLIIWHFMFESGDNGCKLCSFFLDGINGLYEHLKARANFAVIALASPQDLERVRSKKQWDFPMLSSKKNNFNKDFGVGWSQEDIDSGTAVYNYNKEWKYGPTAPGLSVFKKSSDGTIYHTYSCYSVGLADFNATFALLDVVPEGRAEGSSGRNNMWWVEHKEDYEKAS